MEPSKPFNSDLVEDAARRRLVLFVGSGVSASAITRQRRRMKQWPQFIKFAARRVGDKQTQELINKYIRQSELPLAAELLKESLSPEDWRDIIHKEFGQVAEPSDLHRAIVRLNQRIIVTTNFDALLENAWNDPALVSTHYPTVITKLDSEIFKVLRDDQNYLIKLHGSVNEPGSIVFAKSDYMKYAYGNWAYAKMIETLLLTHTFLFLGFSMNDPSISYLVEMHAQSYPGNRPHYIFLPGPISPQIEAITKRLRRLFIMPYSPENGHKELVTRITELADNGINRRKELIAEMRKGLR